MVGGKEMKRYPVKLSEIYKTAIWGGNRLITEWGKQNNSSTLAESWELTVREKEMAIVRNGAAAGMTLAEYIHACGTDCVCPGFQENTRFPLLIKLIDTADCLSVQVHPDDVYARKVENDSGKTEMWYIVDARPGASIVWGLRNDTCREDLARSISDGKISDLLHLCPVKAGECYFIPSGMIHAIGAGILIAEIQQNSDLTYRVYDYNRIGKDGKPRELHVSKALDTIRHFTPDEIDAVRFARGKQADMPGELLANSPYFRVSRLCVHQEMNLCAESASFTSLLCIEGDGTIFYEGESYPIAKGDSYFIPAGMGAYTLYGNMTLICSQL